MTVSIDLRGKAFRKALLPLAVSFVMAGSVHAAGNDGWVGVRTQAAMTRAATPAVAATTSTSQGAWTLSMHGAPTVDAATVSLLEASKPVHVEVSLNLHNVDQLEAFLHAVNDPSSPQYHQFLTPAQYKARYAPTDAEVAQVVAHLRQSGFTHVQVSSNNLLVSADGNANTVAAAFRTTMRTFAYGGKQRIANDSAVQVPQALGGIVDSVLGLQNLNVPHTMHHIVGPSSNSGTNHANVLAAASQVSHSPTDFPAIYDVGSTPTASTTTVGIVTWGDMTQTITDLKSFTTKAGMSTVNTQVVKTGSSTYADDPDGDGEWNLDSQTIVGTSGGVGTLVFYSAPNCANDSCLTDAAITAAYNRAVTDNVAKVINVSLGEDESAANSSGTQAADDRIFAQAVAQGQTFSIASGDAGVYQWSSDPVEGAPGYVTNSAGTVEISLSHYSVSEPASSPNVVAVGGTTLSTTGTTWSGETVWNEGLAAVDSTNGDNNKRLWATGGGVSLFEAAPTWQTTALGSTVTKRQVPDVAFDAASATGANIIIQGQTYQIGGTSLASPIFVGIWARILSANGNTLGLPTQNMYAHFPSDASPLHDVTSGNNGYNGYGYAAKAGYDNSTGWGSLDIAKFNSYVTQYWGGGGGTGGTPTANFSVVTSGLTATFTDSSTDSGGTISSHSWTFGDGGTSTATSPSHTYAAAGTYSVTETVTDGVSGKTSSKTSSVTVSSGGTPSQLLSNPGFETGTASPWTMSASVLCSNSSCSGETAHGGTWFAWMDGYGSTHTDTVSQKVAIPSGKTSATLTFYLHIDTAETSKTSAYDKLTVQVLNSSGTVLKTLATYSNLNAASGYAQRSFDLSAYIGQTVTLKFTGTEDSSLQTSFVLDDAALTVQ